MRVRKLTAADVCEVSGYNRDQLRGLLDDLPKWSSSPGARRARTYSPHDLIVLTVVHTLDTVFGIRRKVVAAVFPHLQEALSGPKPIAKDARLAIVFSPHLRVDYLDHKAVAPEGVVILIQPALDRIDEYLGVSTVRAPSAQSNLRLGPALVGGRRRRGVT